MNHRLTIIRVQKMCGRVKQKGKRKDFENLILEFHPAGDINRPNIKPTEPVEIVINENGELKTVTARWWAQYPNGKGWNTKFKTFNARVSKIHKSRLWNILFNRRQFSLMPVTSFYEWDVKGEPPMEIYLPDQKHYALAGLWSKYIELDEDREGNVVETDSYSFTVFTTHPNEFMKPIHPRAMPVVLDSLERQSQWLEHGSEEVLIPYERNMAALKLKEPL